ncbi:MAG: insulinase family protein [Desulfovibrio sp.]|nr:insulinase family protein [Desulfovibrio sp.]
MKTPDVGAPTASSAPTGAKDEILTRLPNGLLIYIIRDARFPLSCARLYVRTGSANEDPRFAGISHILEHMVFKGTSHRPKGKVAEDVESLGGYLNAATSFDKTWYITDMPSAHWKVGIDVIKDMAFQATLDPEELKSEKEVVISELQRGEDSPMRKLFENLQVAGLKNTPYGRPIIGYEDTIRAVTDKELRDYVKLWYQPQNMMLLVAGDIDPQEVLNYVQGLFGSLKNSSDLPEPQPIDIATAADGSPVVEVTRGPWNKVYMGVALPVPGIGDYRSIALDVLSYLLGGDGTSVFYQKYKYDLQLVDSIDASNMSLSRAGLFTIIAQLDPGKVEAFWKDLTAELARLSAGVFSPEAIARAKFNLEDSMDRTGETLNGLASWRATVEFELGGRQGEENIRYTQRNIDTAELQESITNWLDSSRARVRVMAPEKAELPDFAAIMKNNWPPAPTIERAGKMSGKAAPMETVELENGCRIIFLPDDSSPYVSMDFIMAGGNALLKPEKQGLANLTARLLTDGCGSLSKPAMERWFSERAAAAGARAGLQTFSVSLTGPSRFNSDYFEMMRDILRKPRFEPAEIVREIDDMKSALRRREDQPLSYMFAKLNPFLFPDNQPYGYDSLGTEKILDTLNAVSVRDFWTIQANQPWVLSISGDFKREDVLNFAKSLPIPHSRPFVAPEPHWGDAKTLDLTLPGRNQAHIMRIFKTVPPTHEDAPALMLLQSVLSGQSGILFSKLRDDEGLGYTVTAFNRSMPEAGFMAFYIGTTPEKVQAARDGFESVIKDLKTKPLPVEDLKSGANRLLGEYARDLQSLSSRAGEAATDAILGYPRNFQRELIDKTFSISPEKLREVANKYLVNAYDVALLP